MQGSVFARILLTMGDIGILQNEGVLHIYNGKYREVIDYFSWYWAVKRSRRTSAKIGYATAS